MSRVKSRSIPPAPPRMQDRPGRWKLIWRNQRARLRGVALAGGAVALLLGGMYGLQALGDGANLRERVGDLSAGLGLRVGRVEIEGRAKTPQAMLDAALGIRPGEPILAYSLDAARQRLESIQWVESATVARRLPGTIVVTLKERRPYAIWQTGGDFKLIDREGEVVTDTDAALFADQLPLLVGPGAPKAADLSVALKRRIAEAAGRLDFDEAQQDIEGHAKATRTLYDQIIALPAAQLPPAPPPDKEKT